MLTSGGSSQKKIRKKPSFWKRYYGFKKNLIRAFFVILGLVLVSVLGYLATQYLLFSDSDMILEVEINPDSQAYMSTGTWYSVAQDQLLDQYSRPLLWRKWKGIKEEILSEYDIIQDIDISVTEQVAMLTYIYYDPYFVISDHTQQHHWVVRNNQTREARTDDIVVNNAQELLLPDYLEYTNVNQIKGMFYQTHSDTLEQIVRKILDILHIGDIQRITFMPGGEKLIFEYLNKKLIFHLDKSIDAQLAKIVDISNYFDQYESTTQIDLGSSDDIIVK